MRNLKRIIALLFIALFVLAVMSPAFADDGSVPTPDNYMSLGFLGTFAGAVAAVVLVVQFLKAPADKVWKIPTRYVAFIVALIILFVFEAAVNRLSTPGWYIVVPFNAILVALTAMGSYDTAKAIVNNKSVPPG
jgi:peptidoglycan/LPS O-acetylase OafA/YrhL